MTPDESQNAHKLCCEECHQSQIDGDVVSTDSKAEEP